MGRLSRWCPLPLCLLAAEARVAAAKQRREAEHQSLVDATVEREAGVAARHAKALEEKQAAAARAGMSVIVRVPMRLSMRTLCA
jgi:hypothetical protein